MWENGGREEMRVKEPEGGERAEEDALRQMGCVGVSARCSAGLPWQQAQKDSLESRCDESDITLRGTGVCRRNESAPVCQTVCVSGVCVVSGRFQRARGKNRG